MKTRSLSIKRIIEMSDAFLKLNKNNTSTKEVLIIRDFIVYITKHRNE